MLDYLLTLKSLGLSLRDHVVAISVFHLPVGTYSVFTSHYISNPEGFVRSFPLPQRQGVHESASKVCLKVVLDFYINQSICLSVFHSKPQASREKAKWHTLDVCRVPAFYLQMTSGCIVLCHELNKVPLQAVCENP